MKKQRAANVRATRRLLLDHTAMTDDEAPTSAGAGPSDETVVVPPATVAAAELAWSLDEAAQGARFHAPERQSWGLAFGRAAVVLLTAAVAAFVIAVVGWKATHPVSTPGGNLPPRTTMLALPPISPEPAPELKTVDPPAPAPVADATPKAAAPTPSEAELDEQFLNDLTSAGIRVPDVRRGVGGAHTICAYLALAADHPQSDAVRLVMRNNPTLTEDNAKTLVASAVQVYCPQYAG